MRKLIIQALLVLGSAYGISEDQSPRKCQELPGVDVNGDVENALHNFKNCFMAHVENFRHTVAANSCTDTTLKIQECDNDILRNITACKSPDEQYFPKTAFKVVSDYAGYICSNAAKYKIPILLDHKTCFPSLANGTNCFEKFRFFNVTATVSREEMCSDETEVKECLLNYANETCSGDNVFLQIVNDTFNFNEPPCTGGSAIVEIYNITLFFFSMFLAL